MNYQGLSSSRATELIKNNGFNEIPEKKFGSIQKLVKNFTSPISLMLIIASGLSFVLGKTFDGYFILILYLLNAVITLWQEKKADNAIKKLNENLEQYIKVLRDGKWQNLTSQLLTVGDVVKLTAGEVIPADGLVLEANRVSVNESAITGESLPKDRQANDVVYSGSFLTTGIVIIKVTATGVNTNFGKTLFTVERIRKQSLLEKDVINISKFLTIFSLISVIIISIVLIINKASLLEIATLDLSLIIAGIPISLPTVMTIIIEFGVLNLAKKNVIIRRLSSLEDLSNVNLLLTDKTGTLTQNKIAIQDIYAYDGFTHNDVVKYAVLSASADDTNSINNAIMEKAKQLRINLPVFKQIDFIPADSERKHITNIIEEDGKFLVISSGASQIIAKLCNLDNKTHEKFEREVETLAKSGYRTVAIAIKLNGKNEEKMQLVGLLALSDTLREDAKNVVKFLEENGIDVTMVTGDNQAIAAQIARELELNGGKIIDKSTLDAIDWEKINHTFYTSTGAFAEILPEDKLKLVEHAKKFFVVASTGDGVNDLPAVKAASVGIAVKNAVTALKATADIVLLSNGISVIKDAIIESRKIFERLYTYSLYRISESLRLILTIVILGVIYGSYPMTALQIIILALLNDIPIISLAFDRVNIANRPVKVNVKRRFITSSLFGLVGVANSIFLFLLVKEVWHFNWTIIQTMFFLKLTVSGHMLIYVAHTTKRWWKFLPSKQVIIATLITQLIATILAFTGFLMPGKLILWQIIFVWIWALLWMQVGELVKIIIDKTLKSSNIF